MNKPNYKDMTEEELRNELEERLIELDNAITQLNLYEHVINIKTLKQSMNDILKSVNDTLDQTDKRIDNE